MINPSPRHRVGNVVNGRKMAWQPSRPDSRDHDAKKAILRGPATATKTDNSSLIMVVDQGQLGSCTANASGQAVRAAELTELVAADNRAWVAAGNTLATFDAAASLAKHQASLEFWSRLMSYYLARSYDHDTASDNGTEIRLIFQAINKYGFAPESAWPYNDSSAPGAPFSKMPSSAAFRLAFDARDNTTNEANGMIEYSRITSTGTQRQTDIMDATAMGNLVVFGTLVTNSFCADNSGNSGKPIPKPASATTDIAGGHALCMTGGDQNGADVVNSWGKSYGGMNGLKPGMCKFSWDYILWDETTDLWIVQRAPFLTVAA